MTGTGAFSGTTSSQNRELAQPEQVVLASTLHMAQTQSQGYDGAVRESLLDVVLDRMQKAGKTTIVTRLIYVAKLVRRESSAEHLRAFFAKLIDKHYQEGEVTGMLLCFPNCMVHCLEGKSSILMSIIKETLAAGISMHKAVEARVISSTDDIPMRCYSGYFAAFVNSASAADSVDAADNTTIIKTASDINSFMRGIGSGLNGLTESELKRRLASLDSYHSDVPAPELILSLVPAEDAPTLEEYLELFDTHINVDLDSERVWPMPIPLS